MELDQRVRLPGVHVLDQGRVATGPGAYAARLLASLGIPPAQPDEPDPPVRASAGDAAGRAVLGVARALSLLGSDLPDVDPALLTERARGYETGRRRGGSTRFVACADGPVALTLARPVDLATVPALVEREGERAWPAVCAWAAGRAARDVRDRATLLGLACSMPGETVAAVPWLVEAKPYDPGRRIRVLDLSSLWAGPLCSRLLGRLGCEVVKVEDPARPDGARHDPEWFSRLYPAGVSYAALADLDRLLPDADVVIEGSRPRALTQLGFRAEDFPGVWVSITGYGRDQPGRIGYGDDAAVAGGLVGPGPSLVGDAIADPLTGVHAALVAWALLSTGRGGLIDIALSRTAAAATTA